MVFHTAALGIVYSPKTHEQRFYNGHDDDILCLTVHDDQDFIATGQVSQTACNVHGHIFLVLHDMLRTETIFVEMNYLV